VPLAVRESHWQPEAHWHWQLRVTASASSASGRLDVQFYYYYYARRDQLPSQVVHHWHWLKVQAHSVQAGRTGSSNPQLAKYILVGLELPPSQRSPRQGREAELSPLQGAQKRPCSGGHGVEVQCQGKALVFGLPPCSRHRPHRCPASTETVWCQGSI
jgi:hypothetical protein